MGILDRIKKVAEGVGGVVTAPIEFTVDIAQGAFTDKELDVWQSFKDEGGEALEFFGPDKGLGAAAGFIPKPIRRGVATPVGKVLGGLETAYREGIAEPISAGATAASLANSRAGGGQFDGFKEFFTSGDLWRESYKKAQTQSPGQSLVLMGTKDITDPEEVEKFKSSAWYGPATGTADAILRLSNLDPGNLAGGLGKIGRLRFVDTPVANITKAMSSKRVARFVEEIDGKNASEIRDQFFASHDHGSLIATILEDAPDKAAKRDALKALMGDGASVAALKDRHAGLSHQIQNLVKDDSFNWGDGTLFTDPMRRVAIEAELESLYPALDRVEMGLDAAGTMRTVPRYSKIGEVRSAVGRSATYQKSALTRPLKVVSNKTPHHWVNINDVRSDIQVQRHVRDSRLPQEVQDDFRAKYMAAPNAATKQRVLIEAEEASVRSILDHHGIPKDLHEDIIAKAAEGRTGAMGTIRNRVYDAEGRGSYSYEDFDGKIVQVSVPIHITQQADLVPLADLRAVDRAAQIASGSLRGKVRKFGEAHDSLSYPTEVLDLFHKVWRPSVLLRFGWPQRILMDEQLRVASEIGAFATVSKWPRGFQQMGDRTVSAMARTAAKAAGKDPGRFADDAVRARTFGRLDKKVDTAAGQMDSAFGAAGDDANVFAKQASAAGTMRDLVTGERSKLLTELRQHTGNFKVIHPVNDADSYGNAFEWAVNKHIRQSALARQFLDGKTTDEAVDWLMSTDEGVKHARDMGWRPHTFRAHAEDVADQIDSYLPGDLKAIAAQGDVSYDDLQRLLPDTATRPPVHGEELMQAMGKGSKLVEAVRNAVDKAFQGLGTMPTDALSRQPFFANAYGQEVSRLADLAEAEARKVGRQLDQSDLKRVAQAARRFALNETQTLLYDLAERSELTDILKFISPFYSATQEVGVTWARQTYKNPAFSARARYVWSSPERAGLVKDENGNIIDPNGGAENPLTGERVKAGSERIITLPFKIPGLPSGGTVSFNKKSFNLILQGVSVGPTVQVPVNEILKERPELLDSFEWALPFGTTQELSNLILPATAKRFNQRTSGEEDRIYRNTMIRMMYDRTVDYRLGKREKPPTYAEVKKDTNSLFNIRMVASFALPVAPIFDSPYKPYIDTYRQMQERVRGDKDSVGGRSMLIADEHGNPRAVDEWFYDEFGSEFFPLVQSLSSSRDGVPPTLGGYRARDKYKDLIEKYPELGGMIVGSEAAGEFNRSVYDRQLATPLRPGSGTKQRETPSFEEAATKPGVAEGWLKYQRAMDLIDAARVSRGLPSLKVKAAQDLKLMKEFITENIAREHEEWFDQFNKVDRRSFTRRLEGLREVADDKRLGKRQEIRVLGDYLKARDMVVQTLKKREAKTLDAGSNQDLAMVWESVQMSFVDRNLAFADLFYRFLERDPMTEVSQ